MLLQASALIAVAVIIRQLADCAAPLFKSSVSAFPRIAFQYALDLGVYLFALLFEAADHILTIARVKIVKASFYFFCKHHVISLKTEVCGKLGKISFYTIAEKHPRGNSESNYESHRDQEARPLALTPVFFLVLFELFDHIFDLALV